MKKEYLHPSMFFLGFCLLMDQEKSSCNENPLYLKVFNKELSARQFKSLFLRFRNELQRKTLSNGIRFHGDYQWFYGQHTVYFAGTPEQVEEKSSNCEVVLPKFVFTEKELIVKLVGIGETFIGRFDGSYVTSSQGCWPIFTNEFSISEISDLDIFLEAARVTLEAYSND